MSLKLTRMPSRVLRREAIATRYPFGPIAVKTRFAGYLRDDLREKSILLPREATGACVICGKVYRCELPGTVRMRLAVPCGHWCCDEPCAKQLEQSAKSSKRRLDCPECRNPLKQYKVDAYPGQCLEVQDDPNETDAEAGEARGARARSVPESVSAQAAWARGPDTTGATQVSQEAE